MGCSWGQVERKEAGTGTRNLIGRVEVGVRRAPSLRRTLCDSREHPQTQDPYTPLTPLCERGGLDHFLLSTPAVTRIPIQPGSFVNTHAHRSFHIQQARAEGGVSWVHITYGMCSYHSGRRLRATMSAWSNYSKLVSPTALGASREAEQLVKVVRQLQI